MIPAAALALVLFLVGQAARANDDFDMFVVATAGACGFAAVALVLGSQ